MARSTTTRTQQGAPVGADDRAVASIFIPYPTWQLKEWLNHPDTHHVVKDLLRVELMRRSAR